MATKKEILARAKEIIESNPGFGKTKVNRQLQEEFGVGLRSSTVLEVKSSVAADRPQLIPKLYRVGGIAKGRATVYSGWRKSGFLPFEARELTVGHGARYKAFNARAIFDSEPGKAARRTRRAKISFQLREGWTKKQIFDDIIDRYYRKEDRDYPWRHIREEYKPRIKLASKDYREKARIRAREKQRRLARTKPPTASKAEWINQLRQKMERTSSPKERERWRQQIINLGGKP